MGHKETLWSLAFGNPRFPSLIPCLTRVFDNDQLVVDVINSLNVLHYRLCDLFEVVRTD